MAPQVAKNRGAGAHPGCTIFRHLQLITLDESCCWDSSGWRSPLLRLYLVCFEEESALPGSSQEWTPAFLLPCSYS